MIVVRKYLKIIKDKRKLNKLRMSMNCILTMYGEYKEMGKTEDLDVIIDMYKRSKKEYEDMKSKVLDND